MDRPITTLFMLMSVDGKISTGSTDELDVDRDFPKIPGVKEGLHQYYEIEQTTDLWSFNTGGFVKAQKSELDEQDTRTDESPAHLHRRRRPPPSGQRRINRAFT